MIWIFTAILSHFFWAVTNIGDKFYISNRIKNPQTYMFIKTLFGGFMSLLIFPFIDLAEFNVIFLFWVGLNTVLFFIGNYFYIKAVQVEEISKINIYWSFIPFFSFIIAWIAIGEKLNTQQIIAMIFLITGAIIAGINIKDSRIKFSKGFILMALSCLAYSLSAVVIRFVTENHSFISIFFWSGLWFTILSILPFLSKKIRSGFSHDFKDYRICLVVLGFVFLDAIALLLNYFSVSKGPVALVYSMEGFQIIFVFVLTGLIAYFTKINLHENFEKKNIVVKIIALCSMLIGINLL